jgi:acyl carrier protein
VSNLDKLKQLLVDVFLLAPEEFSIELDRDSIETWDSLGTVSLAVGVHDVFGYHMRPEEAVAVRSVREIIDILESKGVDFDE